MGRIRCDVVANIGVSEQNRTVDDYKNLFNTRIIGNTVYVSISYPIFYKIYRLPNDFNNYCFLLAAYSHIYNIDVSVKSGGDWSFRHEFNKNTVNTVDKFYEEAEATMIFDRLDMPFYIYDDLVKKECSWICEIFSRILYFKQEHNF